MTTKRRIGLMLAFVVLAGGAGAAWWLSAGPPADPLAPGWSAYERGDWKAADAVARAHLAVHREDPAALRLLARASGRLGQDDTARRIYQRLGVDTLKPEDHLVLALGLQRQGRSDAARDTLGFALQDDHDHAEARYMLARMDLDADRPHRALALIRDLAANPEWNAREGVLAAILNDRIHRPDLGVESLKNALASDKSLTDAPLAPREVRKLLARLLLKSGKPAEAKIGLSELLRDGPDAEASWLLSRAALVLGDEEAGASAALAAAGSYGNDRPEAFEPAPFVGAARCAECHPGIYATQQSSHHSRTFRRAEDLADLALPSVPLADPHLPGVTHTLERKGDRVEATTTDGEKAYHALIRYVMGSGNHARTLVGESREDGSTREFRLSSFSRAELWDLTTGHAPRPGDPHDALGMKQSEDSLKDCLNCHTTDFHATLAREGPQALDRGIGCERCHGPGGNHLAAVASGFPDPAIGRPRLGSPAAVTTLCGQCHGVGIRKVPPNDDTFLVRFQATTLPRSRCVTATGDAIGCTTCHDPHEDAETSPSFYEAKCLACHGPDTARSLAPKDGTRRAFLPEGARRVACPVDSEQGCIACHMPSRPGMMPHSPFTDHQIRIHRKAISGSAMR